MKRLKIILGVVLGMSALLPGRVCGADVPVFPTGPVFPLNGLTWGVAGPGGINNNFFFVPQNVSESVCVYVYNNNTTNGHPFTESIVVTGNTSEKTPSDGSWQTVFRSSNLFAASPPTGFPAGAGTNVSGAALVSINISGSGVLGGAPETANIIIVQSPNGCFTGSNFSFSGQSAIAVTALQAVSDSISQSFGGTTSATNPAASAAVGAINPNSGVNSQFLDTITINCSAACTIQIQNTSTTGTCTGVTSANLKSASTAGTSGILSSTCSVEPATINTEFTLDLPANTPFVFDARGLICPAFGTNGIKLTTTGFTGTIRTNWKWYEK